MLSKNVLLLLVALQASVILAGAIRAISVELRSSPFEETVSVAAERADRLSNVVP